MPERYARYGLTENPFYYQLNPLVEALDSKRFAHVASFGEVLADIDKSIAEGIKGREGVFILITGGSGSGRTAVARYALAKYRDERAIARDDFHVITPAVNNSPGVVLRQALSLLGIELKKARRNLPADLPPRLRTESMSKIDKEALIDALGELAVDVAEALNASKPTAGFGVLIRSIPAAEIFTAAHASFRPAETIFVMTGADGIEATGEAAKCSYALTAVALAEVAQVVERRWTDFAPQTMPPLPFTPAAVAKAFKGPNPIERILVMFGQILDSKVNNNPKGDPWPQARAELELDDDFVSRQIDALSRDWRGGR